MERPSITESEVFSLTGWTESTLASKISKGQFPKKITSSRKFGRVFSRAQVYQTLGFTVDKPDGGFKNA